MVKGRVDQLIVGSAAGSIVLGLIAVVASRFLCPRPAKKVVFTEPRWESANPTKKWAERVFILSSPLWVLLMAYIVATQWYETFKSFEYMMVGIALVLPGLVVPWLTQPKEELARPFWQRYWVKDHVWIWGVVFVGSYFWTHYFYTLLKATYTFEAWRLNDVPFAMYLAAHGYFMLYHSMTNMALRRWYTSFFKANLRPFFASLGSFILILVMSWITAFMEAFTIQGFPYYHIEDRAFMYTVGCIVYGLYFVISFPWHYEIDGGEPMTAMEMQKRGIAGGSSSSKSAEKASADKKERRSPSPASARRRVGGGKAVVVASDDYDHETREESRDGAGSTNWSLRSTFIHSMGASMVVTLMLDFWRLGYSALSATVPEAAPGLPWTMSAAAGAAAAPAPVK
jgi:cycloeucalenol cycloisomerase